MGQSSFIPLFNGEQNENAESSCSDTNSEKDFDENFMSGEGQGESTMSNAEIESQVANQMKNQDLATTNHVATRPRGKIRLTLPQQNEYVLYSQTWTTPDYNMSPEEQQVRKSIRLKIFFDLLKDIHDHHIIYNTLNVNVRCQYLIDVVLKRYILSFDLALTEGMIVLINQFIWLMVVNEAFCPTGFHNFGASLTKNVYEMTRFMQSRMHSLFFYSDGSAKKLPIFCDYTESAAPVQKVTPIISVLNRISNDKPRHDLNHLSPEVCFTKLQLELLALTELPVKSLMFRSVLSVVPITAKRAAVLMQRICMQTNPKIHWITNSQMRNDYIRLLRETGIKDDNKMTYESMKPKLGSSQGTIKKSHGKTINSRSKSLDRRNSKSR